MSSYHFPPETQPSVAVRGSSERYAVARIFCVGRNYAGHAREMGSDPDREPPFYFSKFPGTLLPAGGAMSYPPGTQNLHYEMELVVAIGSPLFKATAETAEAAAWAYGTGLDMTRRDLQNAAKAIGRPWDLGKNFDQAAVVTELVRVSDLGGHPKAGAITLSVNGVEKQRGDLADMIWSVPEIIANLSQFYALRPGDLIYTGTPEGVGPVKPGDQLIGHVDGFADLHLMIE